MGDIWDTLGKVITVITIIGYGIAVVKFTSKLVPGLLQPGHRVRDLGEGLRNATDYVIGFIRALVIGILVAIPVCMLTSLVFLPVYYYLLPWLKVPTGTAQLLGVGIILAAALGAGGYTFIYSLRDFFS